MEGEVEVRKVRFLMERLWRYLQRRRRRDMVGRRGLGLAGLCSPFL